MEFDVIGDVHGQDGKLKALLAKLGYRVKDGAWRHPQGRMALFLGDLIDRGPGQLEVISIVRNMIEAGSGRSIMGNHEWNAIGFATQDPETGAWLRTRTENKTFQHKAFLEQVGADSPLHKELVAWFSTLPPFLDLGNVRACHAWWSPESIARVGDALDAAGRLDEAFMIESFRKRSAPWEAMEAVTKGYEIRLPDGRAFLDPGGIERKDIRVRWWDDAAADYRAAALVPEAERDRIPNIPLPAEVKLGTVGDVPTFVGHYWLTGTPGVKNRRLRCSTSAPGSPARWWPTAGMASRCCVMTSWYGLHQELKMSKSPSELLREYHLQRESRRLAETLIQEAAGPRRQHEDVRLGYLVTYFNRRTDVPKHAVLCKMTPDVAARLASAGLYEPVSLHTLAGKWWRVLVDASFDYPDREPGGCASRKVATSEELLGRYSGVYCEVYAGPFDSSEDTTECFFVEARDRNYRDPDCRYYELPPWLMSRLEKVGLRAPVPLKVLAGKYWVCGMSDGVWETEAIERALRSGGLNAPISDGPFNSRDDADYAFDLLWEAPE